MLKPTFRIQDFVLFKKILNDQPIGQKNTIISRFPSLGIPMLDLEYPRWNTYVGHWNSYVLFLCSNSNLGIPKLGNRLVKKAAVENRVQL